MSDKLIRYATKHPDNKAKRAEFGVADGDWWNTDSYLTVVMHNCLYRLANESHGYPVGTSKEQWNSELMYIVSRLKWLWNFDEISMDLHDWCLGKVTMELEGNSATFTSEKPENEEWYYHEADVALNERRQQIVDEIFSWISKNFLRLWD